MRGARPEIWLSDLLIGIVAAGYIVVLPVIMKIRLGILTVVLGGFIFLALSAAGSPTQETVSQQEEDFSWMPIVAGAVDYQKFVVSGPNRVYVARLHRDNPDAFIESSIGQGRLSGGLETVRNMYHRYNEAINYWGPAGRLPSAEPDWGGRNQVVVAINGFFYDFFTGIPQSGQVHSGWFSKYYEVNGEAEGFVWKSNGQAFIGECITQSPSDQKISHLPTNTEILFDGVNRNRKGNELIIYTPQYDKNTLTPSQKNSVEVLVEMTSPNRLLQGGQGATGYIRDIRIGEGSTPIQFDHIVLSARGDKKDELLATGMAIGDQVEIIQKISLGPVCPHPPTIGWGLAYAGIGGFPTILRDGEIPAISDPNGAIRNPRTAIAFDDDFIYFVVVDGRNPGISIGMTYVELAAFIRDVLGADWAINQDGGGSSTMVIGGQVVNNTSGNDAQCVKSSSLGGATVTESSSEKLERSNSDTTIYLPAVSTCRTYERAVANGMLMVVNQPKTSSLTFSAGQEITTLDESTIRLGPGTNYSSIATVGPGTGGLIVNDINDLGGVQAKGYYWWKVALGNIIGWVPETDIIPFFEAAQDDDSGVERIWLPFLPEH